MTGKSADTHRKFLKYLAASKRAVWSVARMLSERGYSVTVPPASAAATCEEWKEHADGGDLFINQRVEVKQLSVEFTSRSDWPFGEKFIVCAKHSFDRAVPKPFGYVILSSSGSHAAIAMASESKRWIIEKRTDGRTDVDQEFYFCPLDAVVFCKMPRSSLE